MPLISVYEKIFMKTQTLTNPQFIELVKQHESLWNKHSPDYKPSIRVDAWNEVAKQTGTSVQGCLTRWRSICRAYARSFHKTLTGNPKKPYYLAPHLDFVRPFCRASCTRQMCENKNCLGDENWSSDNRNNEDLSQSHDESFSMTESYSEETQAHDTNETNQIEEETTQVGMIKYRGVEQMAEVKQPVDIPTTKRKAEYESDQGQLHKQIKLNANKNDLGDRNGNCDDRNNKDLDESHDWNISVTESYSEETQANDTNKTHQIEEETTQARIDKSKAVEKMVEVKQPDDIFNNKRKIEHKSDQGQLHKQIKLNKQGPPSSINMMYLNSLVPFIEEMSKSQVRRFRRGVLAIIDAIEDERENQ